MSEDNLAVARLKRKDAEYYNADLNAVKLGKSSIMLTRLRNAGNEDDFILIVESRLARKVTVWLIL